MGVGLILVEVVVFIVAFVLIGLSILDGLFLSDMGVVDLFTGDEIDLVGAGPSMLGFGCREVVDWLSGLLVL